MSSCGYSSPQRRGGHARVITKRKKLWFQVTCELLTNKQTKKQHKPWGSWWFDFICIFDTYFGVFSCVVSGAQLSICRPALKQDI